MTVNFEIKVSNISHQWQEFKLDFEPFSRYIHERDWNKIFQGLGACHMWDIFHNVMTTGINKFKLRFHLRGVESQSQG